MTMRPFAQIGAARTSQCNANDKPMAASATASARPSAGAHCAHMVAGAWINGAMCAKVC